MARVRFPTRASLQYSVPVNVSHLATRPSRSVAAESPHYWQVDLGITATYLNQPMALHRRHACRPTASNFYSRTHDRSVELPTCLA